MTHAEQDKMEKAIMELERKLRFMKADLYAVMEFLLADAELKTDEACANRIIGRVKDERQHAEDLLAYRQAKDLVNVFEQDYPQYKDKE